MTAFDVRPVTPRDPRVATLVQALTDELAQAGYTDDESFGYTVAELEAGGVHLVGALTGGELAAIGGIELQDGRTAELKRFFVPLAHRGSGAAAAVLAALVAHAREHGVTRLRLETGDRQGAALAFYRRHGFREVPRFGPYVHSAASVCMERALG